jgi:hypothetical protein
MKPNAIVQSASDDFHGAGNVMVLDVATGAATGVSPMVVVVVVIGASPIAEPGAGSIAVFEGVVVLVCVTTGAVGVGGGVGCRGTAAVVTSGIGGGVGVGIGVGVDVTAYGS